MEKVSILTLGIDATNLRSGGGRTHLIELLRAANPPQHGVHKVVVWGASSTLDLLDERNWLIKRNPLDLEKGLLRRTLWQRFALTQQVRAEGCNVLFVPGGTYAGNFRPVVTMSQNMMPFEWRELKRYGWNFAVLKWILLRFLQGKSFLQSDGVIFLTQYAREGVQKITGELKGKVAVIPHGLNSRFSKPPREQLPISSYDSELPYRVLYVSIVNQYKHQWHVVEAVGRLRKRTGWKIQLVLVGPAYRPALRRLNAAIARWDPKREWVNYHGAIPHDRLHKIYQEADLGLFASSCENMPNILIESMAAGLPIACSSRGPMPEILGDTGIYFDPENISEISDALDQLISNAGLRLVLAKSSHELAQQYSWYRCAHETFKFLAGFRP